MQVEPVTRPRPGREASARLREALLALAEQQGTVLTHGEKSWASVTFAGTRHRLDIAFAGAAAIEAGERFIERLADHEFALRGQLVADAAVTAVDHTLLPEPRLQVSCELLLLEES